MSKYVLFMHSEAGHPLPFNSTWTIFASNRSWNYELHENVLGFVWVTLCANWQGFKLCVQIDKASAREMTAKTLIEWLRMG
jgi:hypothetical protein